MKRLLALILALAMIFCLAACGEDKKDDKNDDGSTKAPATTKPTTGNKPGPSNPNGGTTPGETTNGTKVGFSIADLDALLEPLMGGDAGTDVKNLYYELGASEEAMVLALGAKLMGKDVAANLFVGNDIVLSAPGLLDENYGISMETLVTLIQEKIEEAMKEMEATRPAIPEIDPAVALELLGKYYMLLIDEIKTADGITATEAADGTVTISGLLESDALATIVVDIIEAACADDDFFELMGTMQGVSAEEFKQGFLQNKPAKAELLADLQAAFAQMELYLEINELVLTGGTMPTVLDIRCGATMEGRDGVIYLAYDLNDMSVSFAADFADTTIILSFGNGVLDLTSSIDGENMRLYFEATEGRVYCFLNENGTITVEFEIVTTETGVEGFLKNEEQTMSFTFDATENGFRASLTMDGQTMILELSVTDTEIKLTISFNGSTMVLSAKSTNKGFEGSLTMDGQEIGKVVITEKVEGTKTTYTLDSISIQGTKLDFSAGGLSFYIDTNAAVPAVPEYTDISTMDSDAMNAVLEKFMTDNADLIEMFSGLVGGMGGDSSEDNDIIVTHPDYAA